MEVGNFVKSTIGIIVALIVVVSVAIPIISDVSTTTIEHENSGYRYKADLQSGTTTFAISEGKVMMNGAVLEGDPSAYEVLVVADSFIARATVTSAAAQTYGSLILYSSSVTDSTKAKTLTSGETLTIASGTWTISGGSSTETGTYTWCIVPSATGTLGAYAPTSTISINDGDTVYAANVLGTKWVASGDGETMTTTLAITGEGSTATIAVEFTAEEKDGATELSSMTPSTSAKYSAIYAPISWTTSADAGAVGSLISIIPILIVTGLIVAVISAFVRTRAGA